MFFLGGPLRIVALESAFFASQPASPPRTAAMKKCGMWANVSECWVAVSLGLWCLFCNNFFAIFQLFVKLPCPPPPTIAAQWCARSPIPAGCWRVSAGMMTSNSSSDFALRELDLAFWRHWGNPMIHLGFQCVSQSVGWDGGRGDTDRG